MIYVYECAAAPAERRFIAQFERQKNNLYLTVHGASESQARSKAELMLEYASLEPTQRTGFKLRDRLAAIPVDVGEIEVPKKLRRGADLI